ncbi:hypothetical protein QCA50_019955 [Cerrena zonata]|uniref:Uncharacterized protein n=1 Tax=Cerrena zonata TaxID=2478898 RepID=A0AAW0FD60_9APHY
MKRTANDEPNLHSQSYRRALRKDLLEIAHASTIATFYYIVCLSAPVSVTHQRPPKQSLVVNATLTPRTIWLSLLPFYMLSDTYALLL